MITAAAQDLIGIPWAEGGRDYRPGVGGTDCLGLVLEFARRAGLAVTDPWIDVAGRWRDGAPVESLVPGAWSDVTAEPREVGDVGRYREHVIAWVGDGRVLHTSRQSGSVLLRADRIVCGRWWRWRPKR